MQGRNFTSLGCSSLSLKVNLFAKKVCLLSACVQKLILLDNQFVILLEWMSFIRMNVNEPTEQK